MWGGVWWGGLTYAGYSFTTFGLFNPTTGLSACFNQAVGYAGAWYGYSIYAGTPICAALFPFLPNPPAVPSNVRDLCIVRC